MGHLCINPNLFNFLLISLSLILNFQPLWAVRPLLLKHVLESLQAPLMMTSEFTCSFNNGRKPCFPFNGHDHIVPATPTPPLTSWLSQTMLQSLRSDGPPETSTPSGCNHANNGGKPCPPLPAPLDTRKFAVHHATVPSLIASSQTGFQDLRGPPVSSGPSGCNYSNNGGKPCPIPLGSKKNAGPEDHIHEAPNEPHKSSFNQILIESLRNDGPSVPPSGCTYTPGDPGVPCPPAGTLGSKDFVGVVKL